MGPVERIRNFFTSADTQIALTAGEEIWLSSILKTYTDETELIIGGFSSVSETSRSSNNLDLDLAIKSANNWFSDLITGVADETERS